MNHYTDIVMPIYILRVEIDSQGWIFYEPEEIFYNPTNETVNLIDRWLDYDLTEDKIKIELFRLKGGAIGHYLVNLKTKQYYYCGLYIKEFKEKLLDLGIGRRDPIG